MMVDEITRQNELSNDKAIMFPVSRLNKSIIVLFQTKNIHMHTMIHYNIHVKIKCLKMVNDNV